MLLWRESFQVAAGMFISESLCGCTKDIWHHQPAQLSALIFSKDKERESKKEMCLKRSNTQMILSDSSSTQRARELSELRGLHVCVWLLLIVSSWTEGKLTARSPIILTLLWKQKSITRLFFLLYSHAIPKVSFHMTLIVVIHMLTVFSKYRKKNSRNVIIFLPKRNSHLSPARLD